MFIKTVISLVEHIQRFVKGLYITGSYRRGEKQVNDLDFITKRPLDKVWEEFKFMYDDKVELVKNGNKYMKIKMITTRIDINIDIWKADSDYQYKFHKWLLNLDRGHQIYYKKQAEKKGLILSINGLYNPETTGWMMISTKKELKDKLDIL